MLENTRVTGDILPFFYFCRLIVKINSNLNDSYENSFLTDSQISIVRERQEEYLSSPKEVINLSEFNAAIKEKYGF